jgi:hypothetical protein
VQLAIRNRAIEVLYGFFGHEVSDTQSKITTFASQTPRFLHACHRRWKRRYAKSAGIFRNGNRNPKTEHECPASAGIAKARRKEDRPAVPLPLGETSIASGNNTSASQWPFQCPGTIASLREQVR